MSLYKNYIYLGCIVEHLKARKCQMYTLQAQRDTFSIPEILWIKLTQGEPSATGIGWEDKNNSDQDMLYNLGMSAEGKWVIAFVFF